VGGFKFPFLPVVGLVVAEFFGEEVGGEDFGRDEGALGAGEVFEGVLKAALALLGFLFLWFFSLRCGVFCAGGFGLFCVFLKEAEEELLGVDLFAFGSVDFLKKSRDEFVFEGDEFAQFFDFRVSSAICSSRALIVILSADFGPVMRFHTKVFEVRRAGRCRR
jgi:hypothetical protein